jgi:hypothetical protein
MIVLAMARSFFLLFEVHSNPLCSSDLSATDQQYFSLRTNQPLTISQKYFFFQNKSAPVANEQAAYGFVKKQLYPLHKNTKKEFVTLFLVVSISLPTAMSFLIKSKI